MRTAILLLSLVALLAATTGSPAQPAAQDLEKVKAKILEEFDRRLDREFARLRKTLKRDMKRALDQQFAQLERRAAKPRPTEPRVAKPTRPRSPIARTPGFLGVQLSELNPVARKVAGIEKGGLQVVGVREGSPAAKAGLKGDDVLLKIDGKLIENVEMLRAELARIGAGGQATFLVARNGEQQFLQVKLGKMPGAEPEARAVPMTPVRPAQPARPAPKQPGWLGVCLADLDPVARKVAGIDEGGLLIQNTVAEGPAAKAGVKAGDALLKLNGKPVKDLDSLRAELRRLGPGAKVTLLLARDGDQRFITFQLGTPQAEGVQPVPQRKVEPAPKAQPKPKPAPKPQPKPKPEPRKPAWLGVILGEDFADRERPKGEPLGVEIDETVEGGPAAKAGLKAGDILLELDGKAISGFDSLKSVIGRTWAGKKVKIKVRRGKSGMLTLVAILGSPEDRRR